MSPEELIDLLCDNFHKGFAQITTERVLDADAFDTLFELHVQCDSLKLPKPVKDKIAFRSSYVMEYAYFYAPCLFEPYIERFFTLLPSLQNHSARRHYGKIAASIIDSGRMPHNCEDVATACAEWIADSRSKVAVQIWALEVLLRLRGNVTWVDDVLDDLLASLDNNPTPAISVRLRRWSKQRAL